MKRFVCEYFSRISKDSQWYILHPKRECMACDRLLLTRIGVGKLNEWSRVRTGRWQRSNQCWVQWSSVNGLAAILNALRTGCAQPFLHIICPEYPNGKSLSTAVKIIRLLCRSILTRCGMSLGQTIWCFAWGGSFKWAPSAHCCQVHFTFSPAAHYTTWEVWWILIVVAWLWTDFVPVI